MSFPHSCLTTLRSGFLQLAQEGGDRSSENDRRPWQNPFAQQSGDCLRLGDCDPNTVTPELLQQIRREVAVKGA
jgi:hypothetical protein